MYVLFQAGKNCEEIQSLNPNLSLGMIVRARVDFGWDEKREKYLQSMTERARQRAQQISLESLNFLGDLITAFHVNDQAKLQKFIQTGDSNELKGAMMVSANSLKVYKDIIEMVMAMTGQSQTKKIQGVVEHLHSVQTAPEPEKPKQMSAGDAASLLRTLDLSSKGTK